MVTEVGTNAALKRLLENKTSQRRAAEATDVSKTRRPSTRPMHRPRKYYLFYSRCTRKSTSNRDASSDVRVLFFNVIDRLVRKIYQWNNWSILDDDFSYKSQHFYSRKWPIVIVEFRRKLISLSLSSSIRPEARSSNFHFRSKIRGKSLGGIDTAQLCPVLSKFRTMKMEKKRKERNWKNYPTLTFPRTRCSIDQRSPWSFAYEPISSWISVEFMPNPRTTVQLLIRNTNYRYFSTTKPENQSVNQLVSFEHIYFNRPFDFLHKNVLSSIQLSQE